MESQRATRADSGTVHRAIRILSLLADTSQNLLVRDVADHLGLPPSTAHRLLHLLRQEGMVSWDEKQHRYGIGPEMARISARVTNLISPANVAQPHLHQLAQRVNETVLLGLHTANNHAMYFAARADGTHALQYRIELNVPQSLIWGASGKAILAYLPETDIEATLSASQPSPATGRAKPSLAALKAQLAAVTDSGYARSENEKIPGACGLAAPVFSLAGVIGSVCLTLPLERYHRLSQDTDVVSAVIGCANAISLALGAMGTGQAK